MHCATIIYMSDYEEQVQESEVVSPSDPDVSFKYIGWLAGLVVVPLIIVAIVVPFVPQQKKPNYKINTNVMSTLPSPTPETFIATAILASVTGDVQVQKNHVWQGAKSEDKIAQDDVIKTGSNSNATILFGSGSLMRVDANSEIALSNYSKDGDTWIIKINQIIGRTWNRVQKLVGSSVYEVNTPTAVATVRGTAFGIDANASGSAVTVDEGTVSAKLVDTKTPDRKIISEVQIHKQEQIEITPQKVEEVKKAIEERRPIAQIIEARKSDKLPEWIEEHKREVEREAPKIEKLRIEMKQEIEKKEVEIKRDFEINKNASEAPRLRLPERLEKIENKIENKIEEKRDEAPAPTPFVKVEERFELRPTPTPTPYIQRTISYPTPTPYIKIEETRPTPTPTPYVRLEESKPTPTPIKIDSDGINRLINKKNDDSDKKYKKETALNKD